MKCLSMGVKASKMSKIMGGIGTGGVRRLMRGPPLTPKGYIPVSVGVNEEKKRFMVHKTALRDAEFLEFLCRSAEEYGFCNQGIIKIPYEAKDFEEWMIKRAKQRILRFRSI
ncbi:hypothetical protein LguiA_010080 [Lonicera macranthoides]